MVHFAGAKSHSQTLTIALAGDSVYQSLDLHRQRCLLVKLLLRLADVLAYAGPQLHLLIVTQPIVSGSRAISRHID